MEARNRVRLIKFIDAVWPKRHRQKEEITIRVGGAPRVASFIQTWAYTKKVTQKICIR